MTGDVARVGLFPSRQRREARKALGGLRLMQGRIDADALMAGLSCLTAELTREMLERAVMSP